MFIPPVVANAIDEFAKVKSGIESSDPSLPFEYLLWFFLGLVFLISLSVAVTWIRKKRHGFVFRGWTSITDPGRITAIFKRAAERQANCVLELFDHKHTDIYRGQVYEINPGSHLVLELSKLPGQEADFEDFPAQVHLDFRPAPQEAMEHYQFSSRTLALNFQKEKSWRVARVAVAWPISVISSQRRDFLRLEPSGEYAVIASLRTPPEEAAQLAVVEHSAPLATGVVMDISVGGLRLVLPGAPNLPEDGELLVTLNLPASGLDLERKDTRLHLLLAPLTREVVNNYPGEAHSHSSSLRTIIRGGFRGRYRPDPVTAAWTRTPFSQESFQDLAHWINAYQRFLLKKDSGLSTPNSELANTCSAIPLKKSEAQKHNY